MDPIIIGIIFYLACVFIARVINERGMKALSDDLKKDLIDKFSRIRLYNFALILVLIIGYAIVISYAQMAYYIFAVVLILSAIVFTYLTYKILKQNNFPDRYIKSYLLSRIVVLAGLGVFFYFVVQDIISTT